ISGAPVQVQHAISLQADQEATLVNGPEASCLLLLQGKPINEPVVQHGPFVVNYQAELRDVFSEYQRTQFGGWPWSRPDQTHGAQQGRFAKYVDGMVEER